MHVSLLPILPLAWVMESACNGVWHVGWSIRFDEYSPGLVSTILMWMGRQTRRS